MADFGELTLNDVPIDFTASQAVPISSLSGSFASKIDTIVITATFRGTTARLSMNTVIHMGLGQWPNFGPGVTYAEGASVGAAGGFLGYDNQGFPVYANIVKIKSDGIPRITDEATLQMSLNVHEDGLGIRYWWHDSLYYRGSSIAKFPNGFVATALGFQAQFTGQDHVLVNIRVTTESAVAYNFEGEATSPPPEDLTGEEEDGHVNLRFKAPTGDEDGFFIERSTVDEAGDGEGTWTEVATLPADVLTWEDAGVNDLDSTRYCYRVRSFQLTPDPTYSDPSNIFCLGILCGDKTLPWTLVVTPSSGSPVGGNVVTIDGVVTNNGSYINPQGGPDINPKTGLPYVLGVSFGSKRVTSVVSLDANTIQVVAPPHDVGAVNVSVFRVETGEIVTSAGSYTYGLPTITSLSSITGSASGGILVSIYGSNFQPGSTVVFGAAPAVPATFINSGEIRATTPAHVVGTVDVRVFGP